MDFYDDDVEYVCAERKFWAARDQDTTLAKKERKEAQRWVKVCTLVLECMTGYRGGKIEIDKKGNEPTPLNRWPLFPMELQMEIKYLFTQATGDRYPYAELIKQVEEHVEEIRNAS